MKKILLGFGLVYLTALLIVSVALAGTTVFEGSQITHNDIHDKYPQISANGDMVWEGGWRDADSDYWNIYLLKAGETVPEVISSTQPYAFKPYKWMYPKINAVGDIVFKGLSNYPDDNDWEIFRKTGLDQVPVNISNNPNANDIDPQINNNGDVVWESRDGAYYDIWFYEDSSGTSTLLADGNDGYNINPQINDFGDIVWEGFRGVEPDRDWEIYFWPADDPGPTRLTGDTGSEDNGAEDWFPKINNSGDLVWQHYNNNDNDWEIYRKTGIDQVPVNISNYVNGDDLLPKINDNGDILWTSCDGVCYREPYPPRTLDAENYFINLLPAGYTTPILVTTLTSPVSPNMNINKDIVWAGPDPGGNGIGIFLYIHSSGDVIQLSDNTHYGYSPQISDNGEVIWYGYDGHDWEVFQYIVLSTGTLDDDIHFYPRHLPINSTKDWLLAYIELPEGYLPEEIIPESVNINIVNDMQVDPVYAQGPFKLGDRDNNGVPDLRVRFSKSELDPYIAPGALSLSIIGELVSGPKFIGNDVIMVTDKKKKK